MIRRREFITLIGGAVAAWPVAARAQNKRARIAWFTVAPHPYIDAFRRGLRELEQISLGSNRKDSQRFINERVCRHDSFFGASDAEALFRRLACPSD